MSTKIKVRNIVLILSQAGAQRFVKYWECRLEVFGPDKYLMRMTLSEALRDDREAVEDGVAILLPHLDSFGRQILYLEPHRRSYGRYSSESLVRTVKLSLFRHRREMFS